MRTGIKTITIRGVELEVEYEYEPFDRHEYEQTGYRGGIEVSSVKVTDKDVTELILERISFEEIEEKTLDELENE